MAGGAVSGGMREVNSTCLPSGESMGEETALKWRRSSLVGKRGEFAMAAGDPDCAVRSEAPRAMKIKGRESLTRSMGSAYNDEAELAALARLAELFNPEGPDFHPSDKSVTRMGHPDRSRNERGNTNQQVSAVSEFAG